jgi:hypothetical protein
MIIVAIAVTTIAVIGGMTAGSTIVDNGARPKNKTCPEAICFPGTFL